MKTILVVDAESSSSGMEAILLRRGYRGLVAPGAREALSIIRVEPSIDLVVTEMQLPDMEGLDFLAAVRRIAPGLPIIVVTRSASIESYLHAINLGVYEYLNKPVRPMDLVRIAGTALVGRRQSAPVREAS